MRDLDIDPKSLESSAQGPPKGTPKPSNWAVSNKGRASGPYGHVGVVNRVRSLKIQVPNGRLALDPCYVYIYIYTYTCIYRTRNPMIRAHHLADLAATPRLLYFLGLGTLNN